MTGCEGYNRGEPGVTSNGEAKGALGLRSGNMVDPASYLVNLLSMEPIVRLDIGNIWEV